MKSLYSLPVRNGSYKSIASELPIKLTVEERKKGYICRAEGYYVTAFTCLQCEHFEVHNERVRLVTKITGTCMFPRRASRESRKITRWNPFGRVSVKGKRKKSGGMTDKVDFAITIMRKGADRQRTIRCIMRKFKIGSGYAASIQYQAKKSIEEDA